MYIITTRRMISEMVRNSRNGLRWVPDFKTIADFRRDNGPAIIATCRNFVQFCRETGLFQARLVALDGSKFQAAASRKRVMNAKRIAAETAQLERSIATYLSGLDQQDAGEPGEAPDAVKLALARLGHWRQEHRWCVCCLLPLFSQTVALS